MSIKRTIITTVAILVMVAVVAPGVAQAVTIEELLAQIAQLQAQLLALQGGSGATPVPTGNVACAGVSFTRNLTVGSTGSDVKCLQVLLNTNGYTLAATGAGSPGMETSYFGPITLKAVRAFQVAKGWVPANQVGPLTRAALNGLIGSATGGTTPPPVVTPPAAAGALTVSLAGDTPASATIADNTSANFTKFNLTAGSGEVSITRMYVTRSGLSTNSDLENIKIVEADTGSYRGTTASLNADNRALITFTPALKIPANTTKSFFIRGGIVDGTASGKTATLGIVSNSDITSNATAVSGAPVVGNAMSTILLTVGTLTVAEDGTTVDSTPDAGDTDVTVNQFKFTAGSTEAVTIETITALKAGTADSTDTANIELYDVTNNRSLGTVAAWDSEEKATWSNLNLSIAKGGSLRLKIMVDILGGVESTAQTVNADIVDGSDTLVVAKGQSYGFYITVAEGSYNGKGTNNQTINSGALNVAKSTSTPATGNISAGDDIRLAVFDFDAKGEQIRITSLKLEATLGTMTYDQVTNVRIFDENGAIVAGPQDLDSSATATFTDTIIVPVGVHKYTVRAKIADAVSTGDTILIKVNDPDATDGITAKGMTSGDSIVPTPGSDVSANTLTVAAGAMTVTTLTTPVTRSVAKGVADFIWATASLSASASGEDVLISAIAITNTPTGAADADDLDNLELWADLTSANSSRGDVYETKISNTENPSGNSAATATVTNFTLTQTITVPAGGYVNIAVIGDLNASAVGTVDTDTHVVKVAHTTAASSVTATGAKSGQDITESVSGSGQAMTITAGGTLTISKDSSSPVSDIVLAGETSTIAIFRLAASNVEDLDVDDITFNVTNGTLVDTYYFYNGTTLLGTSAGGNTPSITLADGALVVPQNSNVKVTVKAKFISTTQITAANNNTTITATIQKNTSDAVNTTGLASGSEVDSDANTATGNGQDLYKSRPYVTLATSGQPSTTLNASTAQLLAVFDVRASANEDITFEQADTNLVVLNISTTQADTEAGSLTYTLKDENGNTLATSTFVDGSTSLTFYFDGNSHTISAGSTGKWYVYGDLSHLENDGDTIRVWLDDATATNIDWGINGSGSYNDADKIFRNDINGVTLVNPS